MPLEIFSFECRDSRCTWVTQQCTAKRVLTACCWFHQDLRIFLFWSLEIYRPSSKTGERESNIFYGPIWFAFHWHNQKPSHLSVWHQMFYYVCKSSYFPFWFVCSQFPSRNISGRRRETGIMSHVCLSICVYSCSAKSIYHFYSFKPINSPLELSSSPTDTHT